MREHIFGIEGPRSRPDPGGSGVTGALAEAVAMTLAEHALRYRQPNPFKPGDTVQPIQGFGYAEHLRKYPAVVLEVLAVPVLNFQVSSPLDTAHQFFGRRLDTRALFFDPRDGTYSAFYIESWAFELWTPEGSN